MSEISELSRRITDALDRIDHGVAALAGSGVAPPAGEATAAAPSPSDGAEGAAPAPDDTAELRAGFERATAQLDALGRELQRLKAANAQLVEANRDLRAAMEQGGAGDDLVSRSMTAELDALRAERRADVAEMTEILDALDPLIKETRNA